MNKHLKAQNDSSSAAKGPPIALLNEQLMCPINEDQSDHSGDYQSLLSKKKKNNVQSSSEKIEG